jgi:hypothetical protein
MPIKLRNNGTPKTKKKWVISSETFAEKVLIFSF